MIKDNLMNFLKSILITIVTILCASHFAFSQTGAIKGFIYEKETGEPVIFTNVYLENSTYGSATDVNGYFSITRIPAGAYKLVIRCIGYDSLEMPVTVKGGDVMSKKLFLKKSAINLKEVNISAQKEIARSETMTSVIKATPKDLKQIPSVGGQPDIAQYVQILPGVIFTGDQGGQLYIRGGSPIQNKVLLDGMIVYNPFHSIGMFSVFETDILRNADIYTGGFNAEFGGRISSVMNLTTRDGNKKRFSGKLSAGTFGANVILEGPIVKQDMNKPEKATCSILLSAKNSYLKQSSKIFYKYINDNGLPFNYTDFYGKVSVNAPNGSKVNVFGFNFNDNVNYHSIADYKWYSGGAGANFLIIPGKASMIMEGNFAYSLYNISFNQKSFPYPRTSEISGFNGGLTFTYIAGKSQVKYGIDMLGFKTIFSYFNSIMRQISQQENTSEIAAFVKYKFATKKFVIEPGFRLHYYASLDNFSPEPRLAIKYNATDFLRIKLAGGWYSQNLIAANSDRDIVNLFYGFLSGPDNLQAEFDGKEITHKLQKAQHIILGFEIDVISHMTLNIEGYYKYFSQLTNINRNKIFDDIPEYSSKPDYLKKDFIIETGDAEGVDFSLKYDHKQIYLWMVYSLGYIHRYDGVMNYVPHYDRRHNINVVASYTFGKNLNWEVNARWNFGSGFPFTQTQGFYEHIDFTDINTDYTTVNGDLSLLYAGYNEGRLSTYHRLDLSVKKRFDFLKNSSLDIMLSVINVYNRANIFYKDRITGERVNQLPIIPSLSLSLSF